MTPLYTWPIPHISNGWFNEDWILKEHTILGVFNDFQCKPVIDGSNLGVIPILIFIGPCACEKWNKQTGINQTMRPITHWRGHPVSELIGRGINQPISETMGAISQLTQCQNWSENRTRDRLIFCPHLEVRKQPPRCDNCPPWRVKTVPGNWPEWGDRGTIEPRWQDIQPPRLQDIEETLWAQLSISV